MHLDTGQGRAARRGSPVDPVSTRPLGSDMIGFLPCHYFPILFLLFSFDVLLFFIFYFFSPSLFSILFFLQTIPQIFLGRHVKSWCFLSFCPVCVTVCVCVCCECVLHATRVSRSLSLSLSLHRSLFLACLNFFFFCHITGEENTCIHLCAGVAGFWQARNSSVFEQTGHCRKAVAGHAEHAGQGRHDREDSQTATEGRVVVGGGNGWHDALQSTVRGIIDSCSSSKIDREGRSRTGREDFAIHSLRFLFLFACFHNFFQFLSNFNLYEGLSVGKLGSYWMKVWPLTIKWWCPRSRKQKSKKRYEI